MKNKLQSNRDTNVDRFLHDAEHALSGSQVARSVGDYAASKELRDKHDRLVAHAQAADYERERISGDEDREEGCCMPGRCLMPGPHFRHECHDVEMIRDLEREQRAMPEPGDAMPSGKSTE